MSAGSSTALTRLLDRIEHAGNRLPHPTLLFVCLCGLVLLLSALASLAALRATHPVSGELIQARSLLGGDGLRWMLTSAVTNFTGFAPVGTVLVAILGIGVAEHMGLLGTALRGLVLKAPAQLLSAAVVFAGVMSSLAADAGYVVLIPLAGMMFAAAGRSPLAGIAAAFAGVSGGYSANLLIGPVDALLAGISTEAVRLVAADYTVSAAGNYYFLVVSTVLITALGTLVTERLIIPKLDAGDAGAVPEPLSDAERRGLRACALFTLLFIAALLLAVVPAWGVLRNPETGGLLPSPFIDGIVVLIALYAALAGLVYGRATRADKTLVGGMEASMATMAGYLVLMFFAAQFVNWFGWSQLGSIAAISGAQWLASIEPGPVSLLVGMVVLAAAINLLIGSASAKWALLAPVFVPMFYLLGISPEATQVAYRVGDSSTNIITPLMPYFGVVVAFAQRWQPNIGIGTLIALMLPYSVALLLGWSAMLALWLLAGLPVGPGADAILAIP